MNAHVRTFNESLRLSIAQEQLAEALYNARGVAYNLTQPEWRTVTPGVKDPYRDLALPMLEQVQPRPRGLPPVVITGLGPIKGVVVGAIQPAPREPLRMAKADLRVTQESGI